MKKPILIIVGLVTATASSLAYFVPSGAGNPPNSNQTLDAASKAGLISPTAAKMVKSDQTNAQQHAGATNSAMAPDSAKQPAAAPNAANPSQPKAQGPASAPAPQQEERRLPRWRLEGVIVGGKAKASAIFVVEGWGEAVLHVGEKLNEDAKIVGIGPKGVAIRSKDKKVQLLTPW